MHPLRTVWEQFDRWISMFFIAFLTVILFVEVLFRYIFYTSVGWIGEISGFVFVWFIYLSISHITGQNSHIRVKILDLFVPPRFIKYVDLPMNLVWLAFNATMAYFGFILVMSVIRFPFKTPILDISMAIPYAIIPFGFGLATIRLGLVIMNQIRNWPRNRK